VNPTTADTITFTVAVKNIGSGNAGRSTLALKAGVETIPKIYSIPALKPGERYRVQRKEILRVNLRVGRRYGYTATADFENQVDESDETNNQKTDDYIVRPRLQKLPDLIAHYRFDRTPKDSSGISGDFTLSNTQYYRDTLYLNGKYHHDEDDGYRAITQISKLQYSQFTVTLDFFALEFGRARTVILMGGRSYRWFGLRWDRGSISLTFNNQKYEHTFEDGRISERRWHNVICSVDLDRRTVLVMLDGRLLRQLTLPSNFRLDVLAQGSDVQNQDREFTFTNYSNARVFYGYVDNLRVYRRSMSGRDMARLYKEIHSETPTFNPPR